MRVPSGRVLVESVGQAAATLMRHPLRASLAALAMAVAVATVVLVQTGLAGLEQSARDASARAFGSDTFVITRIATGTLSRRELAERLERNPIVTRHDVQFLERHARDLVQYAAIAQRAGDVTSSGRTFENALLAGVQASLFAIRDLGLARGRYLSEDDDVRAAQVVVVGHAIADELFPAADPLEQHVRIAGRAFLIVGILQPAGASAGPSIDRQVWMPIGAFERLFGGAGGVQVFAKARPGIATIVAEDHARISMRARRHLPPGAPDTFDIVSPEAARNFVAQITEQIGAAAPPISAMALIAAIVVVANTTLVSVTQRIREIGVRRAVGAPRASILVETLVESALVAIAGGALGLALSSTLLGLAAGAVGAPVSLEWSVAAGSLAAAGLSGVAAGWYPARRAVALDIVSALRQE